MELYLTAIIRSKPEYLNEVKPVLENMVAQTRKETACLKYDLHQSIEDDNIFVFYEVWESKAALDHHNTQPYIREFLKLIDKGLMHQPEVFLSKKLD